MPEFNVHFNLETCVGDYIEDEVAGLFRTSASMDEIKEAFNEFFGKGKTEDGMCPCTLEVTKGSCGNAVYITGEPIEGVSGPAILTAYDNALEELRRKHDVILYE